MYVGIDYGTSFSLAATMYNGHPLKLVSNDEYGIPSEFYYDDDNGIQVGQNAVDLACGLNAKNLVSEAKMKLNEKYTMVCGKKFTYEYISGEICSAAINKAKLIAGTKLINENIEGAAITIPVGFGIQEKDTIKLAAQKAIGPSAKVMGVIKEPVAAAIAYYKDSLEADKVILVFDLGGGTCDVALVKSSPSLKEKFEVVDNAMERLGGRDWDKELINHIAKEVERKTGTSIINDPAYTAVLKSEAIRVKKRLSDGYTTSASAQISMDGGRIVSVPISIDLFEEATLHLMNRAINCVENIYDRNVGKYSIEEIICVGGSSNMRQVKKRLQDVFFGKTVRVYEPEYAVVYGAAIYAEMLKNSQDAVEDISSFSYGIRAFEDYEKDPNKLVVFNLITIGEKLPKTGFHSFRPVEDNLNSVSFTIFESQIDDDVYDYYEGVAPSVGKAVFMLPAGATKNFSINCEITLKGDGFLYFKATGENGEVVPVTFKLNK